MQTPGAKASGGSGRDQPLAEGTEVARSNGRALPALRGFHPPAIGPQHVPRARLLRRLREEGGTSTVALVAPGGYGKSSLLAEWAGEEPRAFVWLALGLLPRDPHALLGTIDAGLTEARAAGAAGGTPPATRRARRTVKHAGAATLADVIARAEAVGRAGLQAVLVLDELELLGEQAAEEVLAALLRGLPPCVTVALASRRKIPAGLGRLRAEDRLLELGPHDLEMTSFEAALLLGLLGVELGEQELARVVERTEGWPAAIHLAGRRLCERGPGYVAHLSGGDRAIADYVVEEILAPLAPERLRRLRQVSILDHLSGELCDAVLQARGSGRLLRELAREGAMLVELDSAGSRFRIHGLVRDVLRAELALWDPEQVPVLHARASDWFESHGSRVRALEHAAAARDAARTGRLLLEDSAALLSPGRREHARWLDAVGARELAASNELALAASLRALSCGDASRAWQLVQPRVALAAGESLLVAGGLCAIEAAASNGGIERLRAAAERACELLPRGSLRALALLLRGVGAHLAGERERARADLEDAAGEAAAALPVLEALALSQLALLEIDEAGGRAAESSARALETLRCARLEREPTAALALATSAFVKSRHGISDEAKGELMAAERMLRSLGSYMLWCEVEARVVMARASARLADADRARSLLAEASRWARSGRPAPGLLAWIDHAWGEIDEVGADALSGPRSLTLAELRVLRFLPTHLSFREIGERLHVSANTVKSQAHAVYAKLGASSRSEAVARASALGLIDVAVV